MTEQPCIRVLGSGTAFGTDGRGSQCLWIEPVTGSPFLVDLGPSALQSAAVCRVDPSAIDRVFVTHLHGDHTAGWPFVLLHWTVIDGRTRPVDVHGALGTRDCLDGLAGLCYPEIAEKQAFRVRYHELEIVEQRGMDGGPGLEFDAIPLRHHPTSLGYRFRLDGRLVAVSGDTGWCDNLERLCEGCDLAVIECTGLAAQGPAHLGLDEIRRGAARLDAERILLVHLTDDVAQDLATDPVSRVIVAHDGLSLVI